MTDSRIRSNQDEKLDQICKQLAEAHKGLLRALDFRTCTPEGLKIKEYVREQLRQSGFVGPMGTREEF